MTKLKHLLRALVLAVASLGATGCPALLDDNFTTTPPDVAGNASGANGGRSGMSQGGSPSPGDMAGAPEQGGSSAINGGKTGKSGSDTGGTTLDLAGAAGAAGAVSSDPCDTCKATETCCEGVCVDTRFDTNNCRTCGHGCPGTICDASSCTNTCTQPFIDCNQNVVDGCEVNPALDPQNCGNCGIECGFGLECVEGYCVCPAGTADCNGEKGDGCEKDTSSDKMNCGGCGKACSTNESCNDGSCHCAVGFLDCNGQAIDGCEAPITANDSCGSCQLDCGTHGACVAAEQCGCQPGYLDCDDQVPGCETPTSDPLHCGSCNVQCPANLPACDGSSCSDGCNGLTACGASCVNTKIDPENCGGCGKPVGPNQTCVASKPTCIANYADCDVNAPGCETNTQTDSLHCGTCPNACKAGADCQAGACGCSPTTPNDCGATCQQCCNDTQCSDGNSCTAETCNNGACESALECASGGLCCSGTGCFECCSDGDCTGNKVCTGNQCVNLVCTAPQIACNLKCVNPTNDANNCGGCGNVCGKGRTCSNSACTPKWVATAPPLAGFVARERAAYAALGDKVFVWGGSDAMSKNLADGAIYDPATDTWAAVGATGTPPTGRAFATAVWTGSVVVVWGGGDAANNTDYATGSRYDPATKTWQAMTTMGAPSGRRSPYGFWTGSRVLFFAGNDRQVNPIAGAYTYDPVNDKWATLSTMMQPTARLDPAVAWTGTQLLVYGGKINTNSATAGTFVYDLATNVWTRVTDGPSQRSGAFGAWDGTLFAAWGGSFMGFKNDGKLYDPPTDKWITMGATGQPSARADPNRYTGWAARIKPRVTLLLGGTGNTFLTDGGIYNSTTNAWTSVTAWPSGFSHLYGVGAWTGTEFVLWGGRTGTAAALTTVGERYLP